jgi:hypothetical protein
LDQVRNFRHIHSLMGKALRSWGWSLVLLSLFASASAQMNGPQPTPLRFQPFPVYHPPSYYCRHNQRLLLQLSSTKYHVFRNAETDLDSSLIHAAGWLGVSRLPVLDEGFGKEIPADSLTWFDRRDPALAIGSLPAAQGQGRLQSLLLLGAHYAFQPADAADHKDSALFYLQAARAESRLLKETSWDRQTLCLLGKFYVQQDSLRLAGPPDIPAYQAWCGSLSGIWSPRCWNILMDKSKTRSALLAVTP